MNEIQKSLLKIIIHLSKVEEIDKHGDDLLYGFRNYVRRFSLAQDEYSITHNALEVIANHDIKKPFRRCWKNQNGKKYKVKYDHAVPAKEVVKLILKNKNDEEEIKNILLMTNIIVILTPDEDKKLSKKFRDSMPEAWNYRIDDPFARYVSLNIQIEKNAKIKMFGTLAV
jgi:hypothetical protein